MALNRICVLGGSGFVGQHIVRLLAAQGLNVVVPTRHRERAREDLIVLPTVDVVACNVHDPAQLAQRVAGMDAVINLVGVLHGGHGENSFATAHVELARKVVAACRDAGVPRLLHMSALNAGAESRSVYLRTKGEAETVVRDSGLQWTIFRPSVMFGPGDGFLNLFAGLLRRLPVMPLGSPQARFQPVYVEDVAATFVTSLDRLECHGRSYDLCGPKVYTLRELVERVGQWIGKPRPVIGLSDRLSYLQALGLELLPVKLLTRDNYYSMLIDSVCQCEYPLGRTPQPLEAIAPLYLADQGPRSRYQQFRNRAGR
ncbi:MAG: complex I NDUFA9 subunit family protein [Burkholderiales bacterium]